MGLKTLILVRHAKAVDKAATGHDFDRTLTEKGRRDAQVMGARLYEMNLRPDRILSSPAPRAYETAAILAKATGHREEVIAAETMYQSEIETLLGLIRDTDARVSSLMLVGHNPEFTYLMMYLCGITEGHMPKAGVAEIRMRIPSWDKAGKGSGQLRYFGSPKNEQLAL